VKHNIFRECLKHCGITRNIALHSIFDTHAFSGLGTSSSLTVAVLHALHCFKKKSVAPAELAYQAIHVERNKVKSNVGFQDQIAAAYGGFNLIEFSGGRDFMVKSVSLSPRRLADFEKHIFMVYTGIIRKSSRIAGAQIKKIPQNTALLRAMKKMAYDGYDILTMGKPLKQFGTLLNEAWEKKRSLDGGISNATIDAMYQKGMKAGAWGGKLLGAGGGGFMLFFAPPHAHPKLVRAFPRKHLLPVRINAPRAQIIFS
jgi:D-glycero-alpha-D-manno-heptose-7-phosphate kinase